LYDLTNVNLIFALLIIALCVYILKMSREKKKNKKKSDIKLEEYLKSERNFKNRQLLTKFRLGDHNLEIELGRYKNISRNQRHFFFLILIFFRHFQNIYITNTDITQQHTQRHYVYIHFQYKHKQSHED
jgi:uncharacterized membrane protein